jgi:uncharacterized phage protein (TIGR02218 family)
VEQRQERRADLGSEELRGQYPIQLGDEYEARPGCDKTPETCKTKFSNFANFGGFPDVPGRDAISKTPDSKG